MSLFQTSVLKNALTLQDKEVVQKAYKKYVKYFLNPVIQENIRSSKEEEYQGIFLTELFVNILEYTLKPKVNFNLVAEFKNQTNARKADGAILSNNKAIGVIELKGTNTKDLESIRKQAFDYKANQKECVYVMTSNFEKLRFYINDATEFEEFNLFELTPERFQLFYLCLQKDNILNNVPLKIKEASVVQEEKITKDFYKDYSLFKRELFRDLVKQNAKDLKSKFETTSTLSEKDSKALEKNVKLTLFKKSQKLIDRFLFIFFAEDRGLLPANSTQQILDKWKADVDFGDERPLYNLFKQYFKFLDKGRQGTKSRGEIYAYNGGLFKEDSLLDAIEINNELLYEHTKKLAKYDFESQVDVNILGHIFENSLNEIESVNAEIEGANFDKQKSKRKKDGVFYTPKYITKYIVENTVGKLCTEKKTALGIKEEEFFKGRKNRNKKTITKLVALLDDYRNWLLQLTICDPACGSGAFLNQTLNFLIAEHNYIDELKTKVLGGGLQFSDIENTILENNIYGVDLNEESVEIAKLSLWLRTAQPRRKLNDLSSNIKCGNSLIDSKTVAGDKAFHWETQFPNVFKEKNSKIFHITNTIHDSRTSKRMETYKARERRDNGTNPHPNVIYFTKKDDLLITKAIAEIEKKEDFTILAYNICGDHMHLIIRCEEEEIGKIMQKVKGVTSFMHNKQNENSPKYFSTLKDDETKKTLQDSSTYISRDLNTYISRDLSPLDKHKKVSSLKKKKKKPLWSQKYYCKEITNKQQLNTAISYVKSNRSKHKLPEHSQEIKQIIGSFCTTIDAAFTTEYKGGFDVVIGNPPYVRRTELPNNIKNYIENKYYSAYKQYDLYILFNELSLKISKLNSLIGFIQPNKFLSAEYGYKILNLLINNSEILSIYDVSLDKIFEEASVYPYIFTYRNNYNITKFEDKKINLLDYCKKEGLIGFDKLINSKRIIDKIKLKSFNLDNITKSIKRGLPNSKLIFNEKGKYYGIKSTLLEYKYYQPNPQIKFDYKSLEDENTKTKEFTNDLILLPRTTLKIRAIRNDNQSQVLDRIYYFFLMNGNYKIEYILSILNSTITTFYYNYVYGSTKIGGGYIDLKGSQIKNFLIPKIKINKQESFIQISQKQLLTIKDFANFNFKFQTYLKQKFNLKKLSKKLQNWHELAFGDFIKELNKAIKAQNKLQTSKELQSLVNTLTKKDEFEWLDLFEENKQKAQDLQTQINQTDAAIDAMVYELYGLTEDEITIVENS